MSNLTQFVGEDWNNLPSKPAVVAAGATQAAARAAIGAGTSNLALGSGAGDAMPGNTAIPAAVTWGTISGKPAVIAEGANAAAARSAIGAGTSNLALGATAGTALAGNTPVLPEAPSDGKIYGRKNAAWVEAGSAGAGSGSGGAGLPNGGTLGQILAKASVTDQDVAWVNPPAGGGGGGSAPLTDVRSASMNNNSTTLVKALGVAGLTSGKTYRVRILAHTMPSSPSVGIAIGFGGTFGASKIIMTARYLTAADTMSSKFMSEKGVTYTFPTSAQGSPHGCPLIIEGFIMCVGAGTFELHIGAVAAWEYWAFEAGSNLTVEALTTTV